MITLRQMQRLWDEKRFEQMSAVCLGTRQDAAMALSLVRGSAGAAALGILRLDELNSAHAPLSRMWIQHLLREQQADGGWGDVPTTAVCLRALMCWRGSGAAIDRALEYLANLQKDDGRWPRIPLRRMESDSAVSAFVLAQLWDQEAACRRLDLGSAARWFENHEDELEAQVGRVVRSVRVRRGAGARIERELALCS